ncbi:hypothetical protein BBJ28_00010924 [Nothophytophthora sp. Chile5]|nr:hypothetical protein BBJ28_00010924 [Nothophytophthora sp. Chile5]
MAALHLMSALAPPMPSVMPVWWPGAEDSEGKAVVIDEARDKGANALDGGGDEGKQNMGDAAIPCTVQVLPDHVYVDGPAQTTHRSWSTWSAYLKHYSQATRQIIRVLNTVSCAVRNKRLGKTAGAREGLDVPYVPDEWDKFQRTYICTHGWPYKGRSTGKRPKHFVRGCGCPFRFMVQLVEEDGEWLLRVMHGLYQHNHAIGTEHFRTYAENRGIERKVTVAAVGEMVKHGRKRAQIYEYFLECGENVVQKDVDNIVQQYKTESAGETDDNDACATMLAEFAAIDGNVVTADETDAGHSGVISMSSRHMRDMLARFPELLLVDCTHKTNRFVVYCLFVMGVLFVLCINGMLVLLLMFSQIQLPTMYSRDD